MKDKVKVPFYDKAGELCGYDLIDRKTGKSVGWLGRDQKAAAQYMMERIRCSPDFEEELGAMKEEMSATETNTRLRNIEERLEAAPVSERLNVQETAAYLKISVMSVRRRTRDGSIPAVKVAGAYQFKRSDLDAYLESQRRIFPPAASTNESPGKKRKVNFDKIARNMNLGGRGTK
jgi:excisionase family DNA binding protein